MINRRHLSLIALVLAVAGGLLVFVFDGMGDDGAFYAISTSSLETLPPVVLMTTETWLGTGLVVIAGLLAAGIVGHWLADRDR